MVLRHNLFRMLFIALLLQSKIDDMLQQIQNADPTGEVNPDTVEMLQLEGRLIILNQ